MWEDTCEVIRVIVHIPAISVRKSSRGRSDLLARHKGKAHPSNEKPPPPVKGKRLTKGSKQPAMPAVGGKLAAKERRESEERERKGRMCTECQSRDLECDQGRPCARCSALSLSCLYHPPPAVNTNAEASTSTAHLEPKLPTKPTGSRPRIPANLTSSQQAAIAADNASSSPSFSDPSPQTPSNLTTSTHSSSRSSSNSTGSRAGPDSSSSSFSSYPTSTIFDNSAVFPSSLQPAPGSKQPHQQTFQQGLNQYSHPSYHNNQQDPSPGSDANDASISFLPPHFLQRVSHPPQPNTKAELPACYVPHSQGMLEPFTHNSSTDGANPASINPHLDKYHSPMGSGGGGGSKASVEMAGISSYGMGVEGDMEIMTGVSDLYGKDDGRQAFLRAQHHAPQTQQYRLSPSYSSLSFSHSSQQPSPHSTSSFSHSHISSTHSQPQPSHFLPQQPQLQYQRQQQQRQPHLSLDIAAPTMTNGSTAARERAGEGKLWSMLPADRPASSGLEGVFSSGSLGQPSAGGGLGGKEKAVDDGSHQAFFCALSQSSQSCQSPFSSTGLGGGERGFSFNLDASALSASARRFGKCATGARIISGGGTKTKRGSADLAMSIRSSRSGGGKESGDARSRDGHTEDAWETQDGEKRSKIGGTAAA